MGIASLILGIISLAFGLIPILGIITIIPAIISIVLGIVDIVNTSKKNENKARKVIVGLTSSILSLLFTFVYIILFLIGLEDFALFVFIFGIILTFILGMILCYKVAPILNLERLKKETILQPKFYIRHIAGLDLSNDSLCTITFTNLKIVINQVKGNKVLKTYSINNEKILAITEDTIVEKRLVSGDSVGNALLGGLLFGNTGAIVGAISGNTIQDIKQDLDVIKIKYKNLNGEEKLILLSCEDKLSYNKFIKNYNKYILKKEYNKIENIEL